MMTKGLGRYEDEGMLQQHRCEEQTRRGHAFTEIKAWPNPDASGFDMAGDPATLVAVRLRDGTCVWYERVRLVSEYHCRQCGRL